MKDDVRDESASGIGEPNTQAPAAQGDGDPNPAAAVPQDDPGDATPEQAQPTVADA